MSDKDYGISYLKQLKGKILIIRGNHDSDSKTALYEKLPNIKVLGWAEMIKYDKIYFYLSHFQTLVQGPGELKHLKGHHVNLHGHLHTIERFCNDNPYMYNVCCDAHNCTPVSIDQIVVDIKEKLNAMRLKVEKDL